MRGRQLAGDCVHRADWMCIAAAIVKLCCCHIKYMANYKYLNLLKFHCKIN